MLAVVGRPRPNPQPERDSHETQHSHRSRARALARGWRLGSFERDHVPVHAAVAQRHYGGARVPGRDRNQSARRPVFPQRAASHCRRQRGHHGRTDGRQRCDHNAQPVDRRQRHHCRHSDIPGGYRIWPHRRPRGRSRSRAGGSGRLMRRGFDHRPVTGSYRRVHEWVNKLYPRTGRSDWCGTTSCPTEYAVGRSGHFTLNRAEWFELCRSCHRGPVDLFSPETRANMSAAQKGRPKSPEHKAKISVAQDARHRARRLAFLAGARLLLAACGGKTVTVTKTTTLKPGSAVVIPGHPCTGNDYYMACAATVPGAIPPSGLVPKPTVSGAGFGVDFAWGGMSCPTLKAYGGHFGVSYLSNSSCRWG